MVLKSSGFGFNIFHFWGECVVRTNVIVNAGLSGTSYLVALLAAFHEIYMLSLLFAILTTIPLLGFSWESRGVKRTLFGMISAASVVFAAYSGAFLA